jgi:hypothetical protein
VERPRRFSQHLVGTKDTLPSWIYQLFASRDGKPKLHKYAGLTGCLKGKLSWRRAGVRGREPRLGFGKEIFNLEPVADRRSQKQKDKEDGQGQRDLVKVMTCARGDGKRQCQHQSDQGYDR